MPEDRRVGELLQQGVAAAKAGRREEARQVLMQVVDLDERNEQAWLWLSGLVETPEDQRICLENVLAVNPNNAHARAGLEWLEQQASAVPEPPAAQTAARADAARTQAPEPVAVHEQCPRCQAPLSSSEVACNQCGLPLIVTCPNCGQYVEVDQKACPYCWHTLGDFREGAYYHLALAQAYLAQRKLDRVQEALIRAEAEAPGDPEVLAGAGALYEKIGRIDLAMATYERALDAAPENPALYTHLGALYRQRSNLPKARAMYEKAAKLSDGDPEILIEVAQLAIEEDGVTPETLELVKQITKKQPMNARAMLLLGDVYMSQKSWEEARQHYEHACRLTSPDSVAGQEALHKLAQVPTPYTEQGQQTRGGRVEGKRRAPGERPGCITIYAILTGIGALTAALSTIGLALLMSASRQTIENALLLEGMGSMVDIDRLAALLWIYVGAAVVVSAINLSIAIGLWYMKNWARIAVIVLQVLGVIGSLFQATTTILSFRAVSGAVGVQGFPIPLMCGLIFGFVIQAYVIFWFVANRDLFS